MRSMTERHGVYMSAADIYVSLRPLRCRGTDLAEAMSSVAALLHMSGALTLHAKSILAWQSRTNFFTDPQAET